MPARASSAASHRLLASATAACKRRDGRSPTAATHSSGTATTSAASAPGAAPRQRHSDTGSPLSSRFGAWLTKPLASAAAKVMNHSSASTGLRHPPRALCHFRSPLARRCAVATWRASWPSRAMRAFSVCSVGGVERGKQRGQRRAHLRVARQHLGAHDRCRRIHRLHRQRVGQHHQAERGQRAVGAVGHGGVDARGALRRGLDRDGRVAAGQREDLLLPQLEAVGRLEGRQRIGPLDEFGRGRQLEGTAADQPARQVVQAGQLVLRRQVLAHGDGPGVVGRCRLQPDQTVLFIERARPLEAAAQVLPGRVLLVGVEEGAVAGVFGVQVHLAGEQCAAHDLGVAQLQPVHGGDAGALQRLQHQLAEQRAFGVDLGGHAHRLRGGAQRQQRQQQGQEAQGTAGRQVQHGQARQDAIFTTRQGGAASYRQVRAAMPHLACKHAGPFPTHQNRPRRFRGIDPTCTTPCRCWQDTDFPPIRRRSLDTLQVNLGYKCNQSCLHCHVNAGPNRTEMMDADTVDAGAAGAARARHRHARPDRRRARAEPALPRAWCAARARSACASSTAAT